MTELTEKQKKFRKIIILRELILRRCAASFLFFCERYCKIEGKQEGEAIPFLLWPAQRGIIDKFLSSRLLIILKARQLGLTWLTAAYCLWVCFFKPQKLVVVVSAKEDWAIEFLDRVRFMRQRLPGWMVRETDKDGGQHMRFIHSRDKAGKMLDYSEIKSIATTVEGAQGKTPDVLVMDETSRNRYAKDIFGASKPGIDKAGGRIIVISNSHKRGWGWGWTRRIYTAAMKGKNEFKRIFMPWWDCPERVTEDEALSMQLDDNFIPVDFRRRQIESGYDEDDFDENYPESEEQAVSSAAGSYFAKTLTKHSNFLLKHDVQGIVGKLAKAPSDDGGVKFVQHAKGILEVWRWPYHRTKDYDDVPWEARYCIGSDISEGLGASYSVAYVKDRLLDEYVARMRSNRIDAYEWADLLWALSKWYSNAQPIGEWFQPYPALICVETTGAGQTSVKRLKDLNATLYRQVQRDKAGREVGARYGWHESNQSKFNLSEDLRNHFKTTTGRIYCPILIDECSTWVERDGKIGVEDDTVLGDCVIAAGCTEQASMFMGPSPKKIPAPITGWRKDIRDKRREGAVWAL